MGGYVQKAREEDEGKGGRHGGDKTSMLVVRHW
jgi:hypothetical protein